MTINTPEMPDPDTKSVTGLASTYAPQTLIATHRHSAHQIAHAISGTLRVTAQNRLWFVPPGRGLWIPATVPHAIQCVGRVEMRTAYLSRTFRSDRTDVGVMSVSPLMREILVRLAENANPEPVLPLVEILLAELARGIQEPLHIPIPRDLRIGRLCTHLQNFPEDQTSLKNWAQQLGFSERSLIRRIRSETGMNFRELRRLSRVMVALEKLSGGHSVTTTAFDVGFETASAFIHAFRTVTGETPKQFMSAKQ